MKKKQRGVLIIEFVLLLPVLTLLLFSVIYLGMIFHDYNAVNAVSRESARYAAVGTSTDTTVQAATVLRSNQLLTALYRVNAADVTIVRGTDATLADEAFLTVTITATKDPTTSMPLIDTFFPDTLTGSTRMRVEVEPPTNPPPQTN